MGNGGPAFPAAWTETNEHGISFPFVQSGMTMRDYFAGQALPSVIRAFDEGRYPPDEKGGVVKGIAMGAYAIADAMLAQREKDNG